MEGNKDSVGSSHNIKDSLLEYTFLWIIDNFSSYQEDRVFLKSSTFSLPGNDETKWDLRLYPNGEKIEGKRFLSLYLHLDSPKKDIYTSLKVSLLDCRRNECFIKEGHKIFNKATNAWGRRIFIESEYLMNKDNNLLCDDQLKIFCEISVISDPISNIGQNDGLQFKIPKCRMTEDMLLLLENNEFADVILKASGHEVHAHKNILAARSPVFAAMFEHDMEEKNQSSVDIVDLSYDVLMEMLRFIYTGQAPNLKTFAGELLPAADKYDLERLKVLCEEAMGSSLTVDTAAETLVLADMHSAHQLKTFSIDFITTHLIMVTGTKGWKSMLFLHPHLVAEIYCAKMSKQFPLHCEVIITKSGKNKVAKCWCHTKKEVTTSSVTWTINYYRLTNFLMSEYFESSKISSGHKNRFKWCLEAYPEGDKEECKGYLSLYLKCFSSSKSEIKTKFKLHLTNSEEEEINSKEYYFIFSEGKKFGSDKFVKNKFINDTGVLQERKLMICCEITTIDDTVIKSGKSDPFHFQVPDCRWAEDMGSLLESHKFSDVILKSGNHEVHAHMNILAARSQVFANMFKTGVDEKQQQQMDHNVLREMLNFIYTGEAPNLDSLVCKLFAASDKFGLERLKVMCEEVLGSRVTVENAAGMLIQADMFTGRQLRFYAINFINSHSSDVMKSNGWLSMVSMHPRLVIDILNRHLYQKLPYSCLHCKPADDNCNTKEEHN